MVTEQRLARQAGAVDVTLPVHALCLRVRYQLVIAREQARLGSKAREDRVASFVGSRRPFNWKAWLEERQFEQRRAIRSKSRLNRSSAPARVCRLLRTGGETVGEAETETHEARNLLLQALVKALMIVIVLVVVHLKFLVSF